MADALMEMAIDWGEWYRGYGWHGEVYDQYCREVRPWYEGQTDHFMSWMEHRGFSLVGTVYTVVVVRPDERPTAKTFVDAELANIHFKSVTTFRESGDPLHPPAVYVFDEGDLQVMAIFPDGGVVQLFATTITQPEGA